ncbi:MAG: EAL domain-containing protein [Nitrosomonadales bacterium]|nr:EAL domain-containing protein [Nitrosomonadales bacterium]
MSNIQPTSLKQRLSRWLFWPGKSLVYQVAAQILLVGFGLAVLFTVLTAWYISRYETQRQTERIGELFSTVSSTVSIACFTNDHTLADELAKGLLTNHLIAGVRITSGQTVLAEFNRGGHVIDPALTVRNTVYSPFDGRMAVGEVELIADGAFIEAQADEYSGIVVVLLMLEVLAGVLVVSWAMLRGVVGPVRAFVNGLRRIEEGRSEHLLVPRGQYNELVELGEAFNEMIASKAQLLQMEQVMRERVALNEQSLRTILENSPDMIVRYDLECRRQVVNAAYLRETGSTLEQVLGQPFESSAVWSQTGMEPEAYKQRLCQVMATGEPDQILLEWLDSTGELVSHDMYVVAEYAPDGQVMGALGIGRNVTERKQVERQLLHQATHDALTGLPNRALLKDRIQQGIAQSSRDRRNVALVFIDLDNFKTINDTLGHDIGDELLKLLAKRMCAALRDGDTVARLGGDEFVVLLQDGVASMDIEGVVQKVFQTVSAPCEIGEHRIYPGASMGIAVHPRDGGDIETLMRSADTAMYAAKSLGRNNYQFFSQEMDENLHEWVALSNSLRQALELQLFELYYQPKLDLRTGEFAGMEALIRWHHPQRGMVSPAVFIPVAEKSGLIGALGLWVLNEACRQAREWLDAGLKPVRVAVNLSAGQCQDSELPTQVRLALEKHQLDGKYLEVEITESMVMEDAELAIRTLWELRNLGVRVSVDDFGTGYSSLSYLKRLPIDTLKIDKSFVDDIETDANDVAIIRAIIAMSHSLGLHVVAEGAETANQSAMLQRFGCDLLQGYFYHRPMPAKNMAELMLKSERFRVDSLGAAGNQRDGKVRSTGDEKDKAP